MGNLCRKKGRKVGWLWYPYIPFGHITLLQGKQEDGKNELLLNVAASLSSEKILPFSDERHEAIRIIYHVSDDLSAEHLKEGIEMKGGDLSKFIFRNDDECDILENYQKILNDVIDNGVNLVIIDSSCLIKGNDLSLEEYNRAIVALYTWFVYIADKTGCSVVINTDWERVNVTKTLYKRMLSDTLSEECASVLFVSPAGDSENSEVKVLVQAKSDYVPIGHAAAFEYTDDELECVEESEIVLDDII